MAGDAYLAARSDLAASVAKQGVHFSIVDDAFAREIRRHRWPDARRVSLSTITCAELGDVLRCFPAADFVMLHGASSVLQGQLAPLANARGVAIELAEGSRLWSAELERSLLGVPLLQLHLDTTHGEAFKLGTPGLSTHRPDLEADAFELLRKVGHTLERLSLVTREPMLARLETELGGLRFLTLHGPEHVVPRLRSLRSLIVWGALSRAGALENLEALRTRGPVAEDVLASLACGRVRDVIWEGGAEGLGFFLARYGKSIERLVTTGRDHALELVRANPALPLVRQLQVFGDESLVTWLDGNELLRLERLDFFSHVADEPMAGLIRRFGATLKSTTNLIERASFEALLELPAPSLESARFSPLLDSRDFARLAQRPIAKGLQAIEWATQLTGADARLLGDRSIFPVLRTLAADERNLTDAERDAITKTVPIRG